MEEIINIQTLKMFIPFTETGIVDMEFIAQNLKVWRSNNFSGQSFLNIDLKNI